MVMSILQTAAESALAGAFIWAATTLKTTQNMLAPRLDRNSEALDRNTSALLDRPKPIGFHVEE